MFDELIDRTARELTSGSPAVDLRARVLNRIEGRGSRRPIMAWSFVAAAAAVVIAAGVVTLRNVRHTPIASAPTAVIVATPALPAPLALNERERVEGPAARALGEQKRVEGPALAALPEGFEPIVPEPIAIASLEIIVLDPPAPATVRALSIASIDITSLDPAPLADADR
jgi:hypothetical protein